MTAPNIARSAVLAACAQMIRACGLTLVELAQELGQPLQAAPRVRAPRAPKPSQRKPPALSEQAQQVLALADRPNGAIVKEFAFLLDVDYSTAAYHCDRLVGARRLTKVKVRGEHAFRYWSNPAHALAYVEAKQALTVFPPKPPPEEAKPRGEAIRTEKTVETIDTTRRANNRLEAAPPLPPDPRWPSFSSMPPGTDPRTGRAWGAQA